MTNDTIAAPTTESAATRESVLESLPVDPALLESANSWFDRSWYGLLICGTATALAAMATVAFLFIQYWSSGVKERHTEWRTSALELQTAKAVKDTATANERTAELQKEAAQLRLDLDKARRPRSIATTERSKLVNLLRDLPKGTIRVGTKAFNGEAELYAREILGVLKDSGYSPDWLDEQPVDFPGYGVWLLVQDRDRPPAFAVRLQIAFHEVGIEIHPATDSDRKWVSGDSAAIIVSQKP
jgi:hypothetical protein